MPLITPPIKNIREVTEPLKEQILKGDVHTIDEMRAWLKPLGYSDTINEAAINFILYDTYQSLVILYPIILECKTVFDRNKCVLRQKCTKTTETSIFLSFF